MRRKKIADEVLIELRVNQKWEIKRIAEHVGVSERAVHKRIKKLDIQTNRRTKRNISNEEYHACVDKGMSNKEIAKHFQISVKNVEYDLYARGILRTPKENPITKEVLIEQLIVLKKTVPQAAAFLGISVSRLNQYIRLHAVYRSRKKIRSYEDYEITKPIKVVHHEDGEHGWYAVKRGLLWALGIEKDISSFSYQMSDMVYLEEDADGSCFFKALKSAGYKPEDIEFESQNDDPVSPVRNYDRYCHDPLSEVNYWVRDVERTLADAHRELAAGNDNTGQMMIDFAYVEVPSHLLRAVRNKIRNG